MRYNVLNGLLEASCGNHAEALEQLMQHENEDTIKAERDLVTRYPGLRSVNAEEDMLLTSVEAAYHDLGFQNGFRLAVRIMTEAYG